MNPNAVDLASLRRSVCWEEPVPLDGLNQLLKAVEARWAAPDLEPVPSWALDGTHESGFRSPVAGRQGAA
jgi:hypothetical protein